MPEEVRGNESPGAGVIEGYEVPDLGAGNRAQMLNH